MNASLFSLTVAVLIATLPSISVAETAAPLDKAAMQKELIGKSIPLGGNSFGKNKGAIYFADAKNAEAMWEGKTGAGTWKVGAKSQLCYTFDLFGGEECVTFLKAEGGGHVWIFNGKQRTLAPGALANGKAF